MFVTLERRKQCWPFRFLFRDVTDVVTFFVATLALGLQPRQGLARV